MDIKNVNKYLSPLKLHYKNDDILQFNNSYSTTNLGYNVFFNEILHNSRDHSINNYSIYYLTDNKKLSDYVDITKVDNNNYHLVTYIKNSGYYLSVSDITQGLQISDTPTNYFEICFENEKCYIKTFVNNTVNEEGDNIGTIYYLMLTPTGNIGITDDINNKVKFNYILDEDKLYLFNHEDSGSQNGVITLIESIFKVITGSTSYFDESQTFILTNPSNIKNNVNINTGFGVYGNKTLDIDHYKSIYDLSNNILMNSQYSYLDGDNIDVDLLVLKNQVTPRGYLSKTDLTPNLNFREYTSLFTGSNQETGNALLTLNYNYYLTDLQIKPGVNTFTTPSSLSPLPSSININDIAFEDSGAFGYVNPSLADKIYKLNDNNLIKSYAWLSCSDLDDKGIWLSRYYNPLLTNVQNIATNPAKVINNVTDIDKIFYEHNEIVKDGYIDIVSDLTINPSTTYIYKRITNREIDNFNNNNKNLILSSIKLLNTDDTYVYDEDVENDIYTLNGSRYAKVPVKDYMYNNQLSFSFCLNSVDYNKVIADQIFGNLNCYGFTFKKNVVTTPLPIITFAGGVTFGTTNDNWETINGTLGGGLSYLNHDTWSTYLYDWNRFLFSSDMDVNGNYVYNTDLSLIDILPIYDAYLKLVRVEHNDFYYVVYQQQIMRMDSNGIELLSFNFNENNIINENIVSVSYDENNLYGISNVGNIYEISYNDEDIKTITNESITAETGILLSPNSYNIVFKQDDKYFLASSTAGITEQDYRYGLFYDGEDIDNNHRHIHHIYYFNPNSVNKKINYIDNKQASIFFTAKSIQDFKILDDYVGIAYDESKLDIYNTDRDLLFRYNFNDINKKIFAFDYVSEIRDNKIKKYFIVVTVDKVYDKYGREITEITGDSEFTLRKNPYDYVSLYKLEDFNLELITKTNYRGHNLKQGETRLTNYSLIKKLHDQYNDYYIKYKLTNKYNNRINTRIINLPDFEPGDNNMVINFNGIDGNIEIYKNGKLIITDNFEIGKYISENIFDENMLIGTDSFYNIPLFKHIKQNNYFTDGLQIKYFKLYKNILTKDEVKILNMQHNKVDDIVLNIPCGERNKTETINRMFKQSVPGFKTNKFNIVVKNIDVNENDKKSLKKAINSIIPSKLPIQTNINDIIFRFTT